jgi:hypothetical protein
MQLAVVPDHGERVASEPVVGRLGDRQRSGCRQCCVDRIAALADASIPADAAIGWLVASIASAVTVGIRRQPLGREAPGRNSAPKSVSTT